MKEISKPVDDSIFLDWNLILENTDYFNKPYLVPKKFDLSLLQEGLVKEAFNSALTHKDNRLRILTPLKNQKYKLMTTACYHCRTEVKKINPHQSFQEWALKNLDSEQFCIIVNGVESHSEYLSTLMASNFLPLLKKFNLGEITYEIGFFIGNYNYTPFGIHTDTRPLLKVMHLHLGPGKKNLFVWNKKTNPILSHHPTWNSTLLTQNNLNLEQLFLDADQFQLEPGNIFFFPGENHHIGQSGSFSITIFFIIQRLNAGYYFKSAMDRILDGKCHTLNFNPQHQPHFKKILTTELNIGKKLKDLTQIKIDSWQSQQGQIGTPVPNNENDFDPLGTYVIKAPFPLIIHGSSDKQENIKIVARGTSFRCSLSKDIEDLIYQLNDHQTICLKKISSNEVKSIMKTLYLNKAITKI